MPNKRNKKQPYKQSLNAFRKQAELLSSTPEAEETPSETPQEEKKTTQNEATQTSSQTTSGSVAISDPASPEEIIYQASYPSLPHVSVQVLPPQTDTLYSQSIDLSTYHNNLIQINGSQQNKNKVLELYNYIQSQNLANEETYINVILALTQCRAFQTAWDIYTRQIPPAIKASSLGVHEAIMSMVEFFNLENTRENQPDIQRLLIMATKAYNNAIAARLSIDYDKVHEKILEIALAYDLVDDFAQGIYEDAVAAGTNGNATNAMYRRCLEKRQVILQADIERRQRVNQQLQHYTVAQGGHSPALLGGRQPRQGTRPDSQVHRANHPTNTPAPGGKRW